MNHFRCIDCNRFEEDHGDECVFTPISLFPLTQSEDYKHLRSRSEEPTHRRDDFSVTPTPFNLLSLNPRIINTSNRALKEPTHRRDDFSVTPTPFNLLSLNPRIINTSDRAQRNLLTAGMISPSPLRLSTPFTQFEIYKSRIEPEGIIERE